MNMWNKLN